MSRHPNGKSGKPTRGAFIQGLSLESRRKILASNPQLSPRDVGIMPEDEAASSSPSPKKKSTGGSRGGRKTRRGTLYFDSETEGRVFDAITASGRVSIAHGCIALAADSHIEPDFVIVDEVLPDGRFIGRLADAKAAWGGERKAHVERDFLVKTKWLRDKTGLAVQIITATGEQSSVDPTKNPD